MQCNARPQRVTGIILTAKIIRRDFADESVLVGDEFNIEKAAAFKGVVRQRALAKTVNRGNGNEIENFERVTK